MMFLMPKPPEIDFDAVRFEGGARHRSSMAEEVWRGGVGGSDGVIW
jgi:hypothetical protein